MELIIPTLGLLFLITSIKGLLTGSILSKSGVINKNEDSFNFWLTVIFQLGLSITLFYFYFKI